MISRAMMSISDVYLNGYANSKRLGAVRSGANALSTAVAGSVLITIGASEDDAEAEANCAGRTFGRSLAFAALGTAGGGATDATVGAAEGRTDDGVAVLAPGGTGVRSPEGAEDRDRRWQVCGILCKE